MKVPIGATVVVDLWNTARGNGMVRHETHTLNLVRAESDFRLDKGDRAIVIASTENFVKVIPKDDFAEILAPGSLEPCIEPLAARIAGILRSSSGATGGIMSLDAVVDAIGKTSLRGLVTLEHVRKACKARERPFEEIHHDNDIYLALKISDVPGDQAALLDVIRCQNGTSEAHLKIALQWNDVRFQRVVDHLVSRGLLRKDVSYKDGTRYFVPGA
jgi:hypothetical protein